MKKIIYCSLFLLFVATVSNAQVIAGVDMGDGSYLKEYKITYEVSYPEGQPSSNAILSKVVYVKNDMIRVETTAKTGTSTMIVDCNNRIATTLAIAMGKK